MTDKINTKPRFVRCPKCLNVLPEPSKFRLYTCGGCGATLEAKKRNNNTVNTTSQKHDYDSSGKQKVDQVFGDQNQQLLVNSMDESDQNSDHDAANIAKNGSTDAPKQKIKQVYNNHDTSSSSNQQSLVNIHNDPRSSTELSGNEDPGSLPEATGHNRIDQDQDQDHSSGYTETCSSLNQQLIINSGSINDLDQKIEQISDSNETCSSLNQQLIVNSGSINDLGQNSDHNEPPNSSELSYHEEAIVNNRIDEDYSDDDDSDQVFLSCRREAEFEDSSSEFDETVNNKRVVRVSDGGSKSTFKSEIAENLQIYVDEDDELSEEEGADLLRRRGFDHISSIETIKTERFGGYESSVSSFDGNRNQNPRKHRIGSIRDEHLNRRNQIHQLNGRSGKIEHRSTENPNPRRHSHIISENPKLERIELLKKVRELQNQLERNNISNHVFTNLGRYGHRMAFSGETTAVNGGTCHHCCPQDRHFSAQLPRQHVSCNRPRYSSGPYYSPRVSGPSSSIQNPIHTRRESEFSTPDDYRHRTDITKPFCSPKKRQYVRPVANGSPWITCYRCYKLIELPQSFLVFHKRYHSLRCGACMEVLDFTLLNGMRVSRYYPEEMIAAPPSSEVEDYIDLNGSRAGPVSCSDRSFQRGYSTETDRNFWEFSKERRKATMSRDPSGSSQPSCSKTLGLRKMTSEIEVVRRPNGSPLHRLMGYASPSKVIRGSYGENF